VDTNNHTGYSQVLEEKVNGSLTKVYTYGLDLISQDHIGQTGLRYFGYDGLGSTRNLTDSNGVVTDTYKTDAYGVELATTGVTGNAYRFAGEQFDADLNLTNLRARQYVNAGGRFTTADSYEGALANPGSLQKYSYVSNLPTTSIDPSGHITILEFGLAGAIAGVLYNAQNVLRVGGSKIVGSGILHPDGMVVSYRYSGGKFGVSASLLALDYVKDFRTGESGLFYDPIDVGLDALGLATTLFGGGFATTNPASNSLSAGLVYNMTSVDDFARWSRSATFPTGAIASRLSATFLANGGVLAGFLALIPSTVTLGLSSDAAYFQVPIYPLGSTSLGGGASFSRRVRLPSWFLPADLGVGPSTQDPYVFTSNKTIQSSGLAGLQGPLSSVSKSIGGSEQ
jgi:RHS repeat-associated protein